MLHRIFSPARQAALEIFDYLDSLGCAAQTIMATTHHHSTELGSSRSSQRRSRLTASRRRNRAGRRLCCYRRYYSGCGRRSQRCGHVEYPRCRLPSAVAGGATRESRMKQLDRGRGFDALYYCFIIRRRDVAEAQPIVPDLTIRLLLCCPRWAAARKRGLVALVRSNARSRPACSRSSVPGPKQRLSVGRRFRPNVGPHPLETGILRETRESRSG